MIERVDIKIGFGCNNHCKFCVQGEKRNFCIAKPKKEILYSLKEAFNQKGEEVVFTGGEPCLHPDFFELIKAAKKIGFRRVQIQTNGRMFAYKDFCIKTIRAGATHFSPSVHGPNAEIHDYLTSAKGSFKQTVQGIKNLKSLNQYIMINSVITSVNYRQIPQTAKFFVNLGVNLFQFAFIHITGQAGKNKDWIVPQKSKIMKYVKRGLDIGAEAGITVMTEAIPFCFMIGYEKYIAEKYIPQASVYDADFMVENYSKYRKEKGKAKGPKCLECKYDKNCEGPWREYPEIFGWSEFRPVKNNQRI